MCLSTLANVLLHVPAAYMPCWSAGRTVLSATQQSPRCLQNVRAMLTTSVTAYRQTCLQQRCRRAVCSTAHYRPHHCGAAPAGLCRTHVEPHALSTPHETSSPSCSHPWIRCSVSPPFARTQDKQLHTGASTAQAWFDWLQSKQALHAPLYPKRPSVSPNGLSDDYRWGRG